MTKIDNSEAYDAINWILDNADWGFFIVTASPRMQRKIAALYETNRVSVYDYLSDSRSYSYPELSDWTDRHQDKDVYFILNMQRAIADENGIISEENMLLFNMSRDVLAEKRKLWLFFMTEEAEDRLSTFAYDVYSYVRQKVRFKDEEESDFEGRQLLEFEGRYDFAHVKEMLARYEELEERYLVLSLDDTPEEQLLSSAITLMNIATLYRDCADFDNALRLLERIRIIREKVLGKEHPDTATTYNNIAFVFNSQGKYGKALEWYQKTLEIKEKVLGNEHPSIANTYNNIALVYDNQGEYSKALEWYQKALDIYENVRGKEHPNTATTYNNIAHVYFHQDEYSKALEWYQKALEVKEKVLGKEHPDTASTYYGIALIYSHQGDYNKALEWYIKSYKIIFSVLGAAHPSTEIVRENMESAYQSAGLCEPFELWLQEKLRPVELV